MGKAARSFRRSKVPQAACFLLPGETYATGYCQLNSLPRITGIFLIIIILAVRRVRHP